MHLFDAEAETPLFEKKAKATAPRIIMLFTDYRLPPDQVGENFS